MLNLIFSTISNFITEVKQEISDQCSIYLRQVEAFLENYLCSGNYSFFFLLIFSKGGMRFLFFLLDFIYANFIRIAIHGGLSSTSKTTELEEELHWSNLDETLRKLSTASSKIVYFDEEDELDFINSNKNLLNTTEQTVYVVCIFILFDRKYF